MRDINHYALMHYTLRIFFNFNLDAQGNFWNILLVKYYSLDHPIKTHI